jgi:hypothetical protein
MMRRLNAMVAGLLIGSLIAAPGCARKYVAKVAPFERGKSAIVVKPAPRSGMYRVQFLADDHYIKDAGVTPARWVQKGEPVGFREDEDGTVVAIAGEKELPVVGVPEQATHVMWYHKSKKPTQFGKSMSKTGEFMQQLMLATAVGIGAVALGGLALYSLAHDDDCDETPSYPKQNRKKHRHNR